MAALGSAGIILEMLIIGISIEFIIDVLKNTKGIGTLTGFITNGPEAVCLIVGLMVGDIVFASSTPLGSNFMNPVLLFCAGLASKQLLALFRTNRVYASITLLSTATIAGVFYLLQVNHYIYWLIAGLIVTITLFLIRPEEPEYEDFHPPLADSKLWIIPAIIVLTVAGYFLDPIVSCAAENSHAPKGVIGFIVLSTLTSWPEFKSSLSLLRKGKPAAAILNITVSNITNIWLASSGILFYLLSHA